MENLNNPKSPEEELKEKLGEHPEDFKDFERLVNKTNGKISWEKLLEYTKYNSNGSVEGIYWIGDLYLSGTLITSLGNLKTVGGSLNLGGTSITSLGNLEKVGKGLNLNFTSTTSLGNLKKVGESLDLSRAPITSLGNLKTVGGSLNLGGTLIISLGNIEKVGGSLYLRGTPIISLGNIEKVGKSLDLNRTSITSLGNIEEVGGSLNLRGTPITSLGNLKKVGENLDLSGIQKKNYLKIKKEIEDNGIIILGDIIYDNTYTEYEELFKILDNFKTEINEEEIKQYSKGFTQKYGDGKSKRDDKTKKKMKVVKDLFYYNFSENFLEEIKKLEERKKIEGKTEEYKKSVYELDKNLANKMKYIEYLFGEEEKNRMLESLVMEIRGEKTIETENQDFEIENENNEEDSASLEDENGFEQKDINLMKSLENEEKGVYASIEPAIKEKYCYKIIGEQFSSKEIKFLTTKTKKEQIQNLCINNKQTHTMTIGYKKSNSVFIIPLPKNYKIVGFNENEISIYKDENNIYYFKSLGIVETTNIEIIKEKSEKVSTDDTLKKCSEQIYSGNFDISIFKTPIDIKKWIQQKHKYNEKNQKKIKDKSKNTNEYIENIIGENEGIECMTANILLVALSRKIGYPARLIGGVSAYNKDSQTKLSKNKGHAWAEIYINGKWEIIDATPFREDSNDSESTSEESEEKYNELGKEILGKADNLSTKKEKEIGGYKNGKEKLSSGEKSVLDYVCNDAYNIVKYIENILKERVENSKRKRLGQKNRINKGGLSSGDLIINSDTIVKISTGNPNIFSKQKKAKPALLDDYDTKLKNISIAIDISGSMGTITETYLEKANKITQAYLSIVLLSIVADKLGIDFDITLFSDKVIELKSKIFENGKINTDFFTEFKKEINGNQDGNSKNYNGVQAGLNKIKNTKKGVLFVLSDGDGGSNQFFKTEGINPNLDIVKENENIAVIGYGLGEDASEISSIMDGKVISVIESQVSIQGEKSRVKGFPLEDYENLLPLLKTHLRILMTSKKIRL